MSHAIFYTSRTGNTAQLAQVIQDMLQVVTYCGVPDTAQAADADILFIGFWTDKGTCPDDMKEFLHTLQDKQIFLFGTAGFGGSAAYFAQILSRVQTEIPDSCQVIGSFMCQGKMPEVVRTRYEAMEPSEKRTMMLENFEKASTHPDAADLEALRACVRKYCMR